MSIPSQIEFAVINQKAFAVVPNPTLFKRDKQGNLRLNADGVPLQRSRGDMLKDYLDQSNGTFTCLKLVQKVVETTGYILKQLGSLFSGPFEGVAGRLKVALGALSITRLYDVSTKAKKAVGEWLTSRNKGAGENREQIERISTVADAIATWGFVGVFVTGSSALAVAAAVPSLVADVIDITIAVSEWVEAKNHIASLDQQDASKVELHNRFVHTLRHSAITIAKIALGIFSGVVGFMSLAAGAPLLSVPVAMGVGLVATILSLGATFYKESMPYPKVKFHEILEPEVLVSGAPAY